MRVYHVHHSDASANIAISRVGWNADAIASASTSGGSARKMSVSRMMTVSTQPPV
jgi:hypothetical protein